MIKNSFCVSLQKTVILWWNFVHIFPDNRVTLNFPKKLPYIIYWASWQIISGNSEEDNAKNHHFWSYLIKDASERNFRKQYDDNMTHLLKKNSEKVYNRRTWYQFKVSKFLLFTFDGEYSAQMVSFICEPSLTPN